MSKLSNLDMSSNPLFLMLMFVLLIIVFLAIFRSVSPFMTMGLGLNAHIGGLKGSFQIEAFENQMKMNGPTFVIFYADWCGHCKRTMPEFNEFKKSYNGPINVMAVNSEDESNADLIKSQNIQGFPTIRYYPKGLSENFEEYNGGRTAKDFYSYVQQISGVMDNAQGAAPI
jgi:thiol-disulfide isomerase/thioredoxin